MRSVVDFGIKTGIKQELNIKLSLENTNGLVVIIQGYYVNILYQCKSCENSKWI